MAYSRRQFIKYNSFAGLGALALGSLANCTGESRKTDSRHLRNFGIQTIADMDLQRIKDRYESALFDRFIPNMDELVIDHEFGGFMCDVNIATRKLESTTKLTWYQGRGIWMYSFLYNHFGKDPKYLEIARKAKDFIVKLLPSDDRFYPASYTKDGVPLSLEEGNIYGNLFVAEGLAEYAKASEERQWFDLAKEILFKAVERYDRPDYAYTYKAENVEAGPRILGHWMILISLATQMLRQESDPQIQALADRCVEALTVHHLSPKYNLVNEAISHELRPLNDPIATQFSDVCHGSESFAFVMNYAIFRKDAELFRTASDLFRRHVTVAADPVYGGYFSSMDDTDNNMWRLDKLRWVHDEILIGSLTMVEHIGDPWAVKCFLETDAYVQEKFVRPEYAFIIDRGDRWVEEHSQTRAENYHHPRQLMACLLAIDRIIGREYQISGLFTS